MTWSKVGTVGWKVATVVVALVSVMHLVDHEYAPATLFGGFFLTGLGEWINHPTAGAPRKANRIGIWFEVVGIILTICGAFLWLMLPQSK